MTEVRAELRRWLTYAMELGIEDLPVRLTERSTLTTPTAAEVRTNRPSADSVLAEASPPQTTSTRPAPKSPAPAVPVRAGAESTTSVAEAAGWQRAKALMTASQPVAPAATVAAQSAVSHELDDPTRPLPRMGEVPAELLAIPNEHAAATPTLEALRALIGDCKRCRLCEQRTKVVFGSGNPQAELMFVGEGPGHDEDLQGEPFVGRAGQLLTDIIKAIGRTRDDVYIANIVKCRPPQNRNPQPDEVAMCRGFLFRQLALIRPRVVVALGKPATEMLLDRPVSIMAIRGQMFDLLGARLIPTFHPAFLLRTPDRKRDVWEDMKKVRDLLQRGQK